MKKMDEIGVACSNKLYILSLPEQNNVIVLVLLE